MSRRSAFGIVGGYGSTGKVVASLLRDAAASEILVGGRDLTKATALANELGAGVSASRADVLSEQSLDDFCRQCNVVINCAGPVTVLQDRVAQAAFRCGCHYVDPAGMTFVAESMRPHDHEIAEQGLSFVVSAGWLPGITELLPTHAFAIANQRMKTIESVTVYYGDSGEWSENAVADAVWHIRRTGVFSPRYFHHGEPVRANMSAASRELDLGDRLGLGKRRFSLFSTPEQIEVSRQFRECDFLTYSCVPSASAVAKTIIVATCPVPKWLAVSLLASAMRSARLPVGGFAVAHVSGVAGGSKVTWKEEIMYPQGRDYWMNARVLATVARMIAEGNAIKRGVHFLFEAADPADLVGALQTAGVQYSERLDYSE